MKTNSPPALAQRPSRRVPARWENEVESVLISQGQLQRRIQILARQLERDYTGSDLVLVPLLTGTVMFLADLIRCLNLPLRLDFMGVSSYRQDTRSGRLVITKELRLDVRDRDVLVVDDILDTGRTLACARAKLLQMNPRSLKICVLLDKPARRQMEVHADYVGFTIPDFFVVGYGLDYAERYRNLSFVGVLKPELYR